MGRVITLTDPALKAEWEQKIQNPSPAEIQKIVHRLRNPQFDKFFDLLETIAVVSQGSPDAGNETFKSLCKPFWLIVLMQHSWHKVHHGWNASSK